MGKLIYMMNVSLDGFVARPDGSLDWTRVDDELHSWFAEHQRGLSASLYGRRLYELMSAYWPTSDSDPDATEGMREYGRSWRATPRIVFSSTLESVDHNSRLARGDIGEELARVRQEFDGDLEVAGPTLAKSFIRRGLVDAFGLVVHPVVLGAGITFFPELESPIRLRMTETRPFESGVVYVGYERA
ncbi:MAG TPA: dihydrofolate reductase family protein [Candidatus Limnocylindrales bacterium]|nr:dihydrofolate reductase family protein [Candidatus Limnocylindrales bacterium]